MLVRLCACFLAFLLVCLLCICRLCACFLTYFLVCLSACLPFSCVLASSRVCLLSFLSASGGIDRIDRIYMNLLFACLIPCYLLQACTTFDYGEGSSSQENIPIASLLLSSNKRAHLKVYAPLLERVIDRIDMLLLPCLFLLLNDFSNIL
jgi:hypothetical protein